MLTGAADGSHRLKLLVGGPMSNCFVTQQIRVTENRRERRADLVAHVGQKLAFALTGGFRALLRLQQGLLAFDGGRDIHDGAIQPDHVARVIADGTSFNPHITHAIRPTCGLHHHGVRNAGVSCRFGGLIQPHCVGGDQVGHDLLERRHAGLRSPSVQQINFACPLNLAGAEVE